jgi:hypothetical protein
MTTLQQEWVNFVLKMAHTPELIIAGVQRIHRDVGWSLDPEVFFDGSLTLRSTGYTETKLGALKRNYYNPDSIARAKADLAWRIEHKKYGSGGFDFRGIPKKGTKQDYCIQSCVISYYPQRKGTSIQVFWRTAELIKRFRGDLIFLRDFIFPHFRAELMAAPPFAIDFRFANCTFHPMFTVLLAARVPDLRAHCQRIRMENPKLFQSMMYWGWRYLCDTSKSIDSYSSARQVRLIAKKTTSPDQLEKFRKFIERAIFADLENYPDSVINFYKRRAVR